MNIGQFRGRYSRAVVCVAVSTPVSGAYAGVVGQVEYAVVGRRRTEISTLNVNEQHGM